jgi:uncharacterized damage-inducible protein DinB
MSEGLNLLPFDWDGSCSLGSLLNDVMVIQHFPTELAKVIAQIQADQVDLSYREGGWSIKQIIHHLADAHMNAYVRTKHILAQDQQTIQPYDENLWNEMPDAQFHHEASYLILLGLHQKWSLLLLESLKDPATHLAKTLFHPESERQLSLSDLIRLYAWHGEHHLAQIRYALQLANAK